MPRSHLTSKDRKFLILLGHEIKRMILQEKQYSSLDRFSLEYSEEITKPTLYDICDGKRDFKFSTIISLSRALEIHPLKLLKKVSCKF